jgi:hypothetical protein
MEMLLEKENRKRIFNGPAQIAAEIRTEWKEIVFISLPIVAIAVFLQIYTGKITTALTTGGPVDDAILGRIAPVDLSVVFVWGYIIDIAVNIILVTLVDVRQFRQAAYFFSLIVIVRAGFILLTGLRSPVGSLPVNFPGFTGNLQAENDLFFSGHVAIPFMAYLFFKERKKPIRFFFLACSLTLGATALIMHRHYSIDVAAAPFICFGVYTLGKNAYPYLRKLVAPRGGAGNAEADGED